MEMRCLHEKCLILFPLLPECLVYLNVVEAVLFDVNGERHIYNVLWTEFTLFTDGSAVEVQLRRAGSLSGKSPDAGICGFQGVAGRCLQLQRTL